MIRAFTFTCLHVTLVLSLFTHSILGSSSPVPLRWSENQTRWLGITKVWPCLDWGQRNNLKQQKLSPKLNNCFSMKTPHWCISVGFSEWLLIAFESSVIDNNISILPLRANLPSFQQIKRKGKQLVLNFHAFSRPIHWFLVYPSLAMFSCFIAFGKVWNFSRALQSLHVFCRLATLACFLSLNNVCLFLCALWSSHVFLHLAKFYSFPGAVLRMGVGCWGWGGGFSYKSDGSSNFEK